jgi:hypothetical protein
MGKIEITKNGNTTKLTLPPELNYYLKNKNFINERFFRVSIDIFNDVFVLMISNYYWDKNCDCPKYAKSTKYRLRKKEIGLCPLNISRVRNLDKIITKPNNRKSVCGTYRMDYNIIEDGNYFTVISHFRLTDLYQLPDPNRHGFVETVRDVLTTPYYDSQIYNRIDRHSEEFYHSLSRDVDSVTYVTKDKFIDTAINTEDYVYLDSPQRRAILEKHSRTTSLSKFITKLFPEVDNKMIQQYVEYNKLLSTYDPSLFEIVTGDDIVKYYNQDSYFRSTGDLGGSCMRQEEKTHLIQFYAKNSNVSLIIMKVKDSDAIIARALLWTTTTGVKVVDRIYTADSRIVSLFHKYIDENEFLNVYKIKKPLDTRNLTSMSPSYWIPDYDENHIVDLEYLPEHFINSNYKNRFMAAFTVRRTSLNDAYDFPYMDNFNLVNSISMQISLLPIETTFKCTVSDTYITLDNHQMYDYLEGVYNKELVELDDNNVPVLIEDVVTLDAPDTSVNIPLELPNDADIDDWNDDPEEEELGWDEFENIITQQITNQQSYNTLDTSVITRIIGDVTITNQNNV